MKKTFYYLSLALCLWINSNAFAQTPNAIPYQAVARNSSGNLLVNQNVRVRFTILNEAMNGGALYQEIVYQENQTVTTNNLGLFTVNIGQGTATTGTFATINWGTGFKYTQVEIDVNGGTNYVDMGTQQMMSVPYALYAANANVPGVAGPQGPQGVAGPQGVQGEQGAAGSFSPGTNAGEIRYWNGIDWVPISSGTNEQTLTIINGVPMWQTENQ